ncbi:hypothetical protein MP11Mi_03570 [Gordonia sp. MP11Mi]|uniref:Uncharacterized protein n=1 Tax=Gordonia sp. MP11Mi TaxID=3022769 RepID=A0AA97GU64_9ACTN
MIIDPIGLIGTWINSIPGLPHAISDITAFLNSIAY